MADILLEIFEAVRKGNAAGLEQLIRAALAQGMGPGAILDGGLIPAMTDVGERWKRDEIFMPEVMIAARAMKAGMNLLDPLLSQQGVAPKGKIILGTVKGDLHNIGKNLVVMMLEGGGFEVVDLGIDVPVTKFIEAIKQHQPQVVGMSALLTTTMREMKNTIQAIEWAGLKEQVKTIVGGAPVTERFAREIGADGYAADAVSAVDLVKSLLAK